MSLSSVSAADPGASDEVFIPEAVHRSARHAASIASDIWPNASPPDPSGMCAEISRELARGVVEYWKDCRGSAELNPQAPLDIIDLVPSSGKSCWLMMQSLVRACNDGFQWRYLPLVPEYDWLLHFSAKPEFNEALKKGYLVPLLWNMTEGKPMLLNLLGQEMWAPDNPVVVLAHDRFAYMRQRFLAVHYGKLMEVDTKVNSDPKSMAEVEAAEGGGTAGWQWKLIDQIQHEEASGICFDRYLAKLNSAPIPFPEGALKFIRAVHQKARCGYLMISLGAGMATEQDLRMASFPQLLDELRCKHTLPINFHIIGHYLNALEVCSAVQPLQDGRFLHLALGGNAAETQGRLQKIAALIAAHPPKHTDSLTEAAKAIGSAPALEVRLALLQLADFDPSVFMSADKALIAALASASQSGNLDKKVWRQALDRVWSNYLPDTGELRLHQSLAPAAMHCGAWSLARKVLQRGMECFGESATDLANLAWCENRTGQAELARSLVERALEIDATNVLANEVLRRVEERIATRDEKWRMVLRDPDSGLVLEPLDSSHADALFYQYRDPQIAVMTGLPPIKSRDEVRQWIEDQSADEKKINYAIVLPEEGFAGFINLAVSEHAAFFCFWTGVDFQERGLAAMAGRVVCDYASRLGIRVILTSAFNDNQRSIRALKRMGFIELPIRALPPDNDRIFFILAGSEHDLHQDKNTGVKELVKYYARENLALLFPPVAESKNDDIQPPDEVRES